MKKGMNIFYLLLAGLALNGAFQGAYSMEEGMIEDQQEGQGSDDERNDIELITSDPDKNDTVGWLCRAAFTGDVALAETLIKNHGNKLVDKLFNERRHPFYFACVTDKPLSDDTWSKKEQIALKFLALTSHGIDDPITSEEETFLHCATAAGFVEVVKRLIGMRADPRKQDLEGLDVPTYAIEYPGRSVHSSAIAILKLLLPKMEYTMQQYHGLLVSILHAHNDTAPDAFGAYLEAIVASDPTITKNKLINSSDAELQGTLLHYATSINNVPLIDFLISEGCQLSQDVDGNNCMHEAVLGWTLDAFVRLLTLAPSLAHQKNGNDSTPLEDLAESVFLQGEQSIKKNAALMKKLVEKGPDGRLTLNSNLLNTLQEIQRSQDFYTYILPKFGAKQKPSVLCPRFGMYEPTMLFGKADRTRVGLRRLHAIRERVALEKQKKRKAESVPLLHDGQQQVQSVIAKRQRTTESTGSEGKQEIIIDASSTTSNHNNNDSTEVTPRQRPSINIVHLLRMRELCGGYKKQ